MLFLLLPQAGQCFYNTSTGRWLSRDPIGEDGGLNLSAFVRNRPVLDCDRLGHEDLETIRESFDKWYNEQKAHMDWLKTLPDCPCKLPKGRCYIGPIYPGLSTDMFVAPDGWTLAPTLFLQKYHPGGVYDLRQDVTKGKSGQQCVYDTDGKLITHGPAAGTPDLVGSQGSLGGHMDADVTPFEWAEKLDAPPTPNPNGKYYQEYMEVRPPNSGKDSTTGQPCPKNP